MERATVTVRVDEAALPAGAVPANVTLLRYDGGGWTELETTYDAEADVYRADATGLSTLAVAVVESGSVEVVDASVPADWVRRGYTTSVRATVRNPGDSPVTRTLAVTVNGEPVAHETVTLAPGERAVVTVEIPAVEGAVSVEGVDAGSLAVGPAAAGHSDGPGSGRPPDLQPGWSGFCWSWSRSWDCSG